MSAKHPWHRLASRHLMSLVHPGPQVEQPLEVEARLENCLQAHRLPKAASH